MMMTTLRWAVRFYWLWVSSFSLESVSFILSCVYPFFALEFSIVSMYLRVIAGCRVVAFFFLVSNWKKRFQNSLLLRFLLPRCYFWFRRDFCVPTDLLGKSCWMWRYGCRCFFSDFFQGRQWAPLMLLLLLLLFFFGLQIAALSTFNSWSLLLSNCLRRRALRPFLGSHQGILIMYTLFFSFQHISEEHIQDIVL